MERIEKSYTVARGSESKIRCILCGRVYQTIRGLQRHIGKRHSEMLCAVCGERFPSLDELRNHKKIHRKLYTCHMCTYTSFFTQNLRLHALKHSQDTRYNCLICKQPFRRPADLTMHLKRDH